jgi:iron-sulfur cluster repair protein YtfE (RIC family)
VDIFEELHAEHERVSELIARLQDGGRDEATLKTLQSELSSHAEAEEQVFYARLEDEGATKDTVAEGYEEHEAISRALTQLAGPLGESTFPAALAELRENVEHHIGEEEGTLFEQAKPLLSEDEAVALREQFELTKSRLQGRA